MQGRSRIVGQFVFLTWVAMVVSPGWAGAQSNDGPQLSFTGRVHAQFRSSSVDDAIGSESLLRRARVTAVLKVNDLVSGQIQPDFAGGSASLRNAFLKLSFSDYFNVTMGQFKRSFDLFELESSTRMLVVERAGSIEGAGSCAGIGGICSYGRFTEKLGYAGRDVGVGVNGTLGDLPLSYGMSVTNGEGQNKPDINSGKSFSGRVEYAVLSDLDVSVNVSVHDYDNLIDPTRAHATAWGVDVDWGSYSPGLHLQGAFVGGQNWKDLSAAGSPSDFLTTQGTVTYLFPVTGTEDISGIEPVFRVSWADPDSDADSDREVFLTTGVILHFIGRNRVAANIDVWDPAMGDKEWSFKVQTYLHF